MEQDSEDKDLDKSFKDLEEKLNSMGKFDFEKVEAFLKKMYPEKWLILSAEKKGAVINELQDFLNDPQKMEEIEGLFKMMDEFKSTRFNINILLLGILLGVSGNLVANLFDRYFLIYGLSYDIIVVVVFLLFIWVTYIIFIKRTEKEINTKKIWTDLSAIFDKVEKAK